MRLLVLGGTAWLGGTVAATARDAGHEVTCAARGTSGAVVAGVGFVAVDRDRDGTLAALADDRWDAVIDVARQPGHVRRAAAALAASAGHYLLVSTTNVYAEHRAVGADETAPLLPALDSDVMESMEQYGAAKVACESHVLEAFGPERATLVRSGLIAGPGDVSDRTGYWPLRFARPAAPRGAVLVPDAREDWCQLLDVRDLSTWLVDVAANAVPGAFDAVGPRSTLGAHLDVARAVSGHTGPVVAADGEWLRDRGVQPWMGPRSLPLWTGDQDEAGFLARDGGRARAAGLATRPLEDTFADALAWELGRAPGQERRAGLGDDDERALLAELDHSGMR